MTIHIFIIQAMEIASKKRFSKVFQRIVNQIHTFQEKIAINVAQLNSQEMNFASMDVGYRGWFAIWGDEAWDDGNTNNGDGWKQIGSGLRSGSPSSVSPCFGEQSQFLLELEQIKIWTRSIPISLSKMR